MSKKLALNAERLLAEEGPIAVSLDGYQPRRVQQQLATAIEEAIADDSLLIAEAGTGIGKTFAYLVPTLNSGKKVIISTGTKNLQDQLYQKDLPLIRKALALPKKIAILKGRSNYLCKYRIEQIPQENKVLLTKDHLNQLEIIRRQMGKTQFGDTNEIVEIPEDSPVWFYATSTVDNCLGQECPLFKDCYLVKARRKAIEADIIVVNHHLFFADLILKDDGLGDLLPDVDVIVMDEAHQVPEIASQFFGIRISSRQLQELAIDTELEYIREARDAKQLQKASERLKKSIKDMRLAFGENEQRKPWNLLASKESLQKAIQKVSEELTFLRDVLKEHASRSKQLESCWQRAVELLEQFELLTGNTPKAQIHWCEVFSKSFIIHFTPMQVAKQFDGFIKEKSRSWIFTSATLAMNGDFSHFIAQLGLDDARQIKLDSPFDYEKQSLLYLPRYLPDPNDETYTETMLSSVIPVLKSSQGRAFLLLTSHRAVRIAAQRLEQALDYPIFVQGDMGKNQLLEQFKKTQGAILVGTTSFWEGVDVRGAALSCVIIDKLPFVVPNDPVLKARSEQIKQSGGDPFYDYQLPNTAIMLQQGVGRLIRDPLDRGVLMICDPRLITREYGRLLLGSLPKIPKTRDLEKVEAFDFM